jgi:hypothetical protein
MQGQANDALLFGKFGRVYFVFGRWAAGIGISIYGGQMITDSRSQPEYIDI